MTDVDVLVLGFGAAGAAAAIEAHDAGARVLVAEKMGFGGGNCLHSGGFLFDIGGTAAVDHLDALFFGWFAFTHPDHVAGFPLDVHAPSFIYVDAEGRRFADETPNDYAWSADNSAEVDADWIKRAGSSEELAAAICADELPDTLRAYGTQPDEFGRAPETVVALEPPLYAIQMHPGVATASGGARHDERARALRTDGSAVAGLYVAGAAGSIWGHLTEHGGGLTDALVFGRIAGGAAAKTGP
jgi:succinate dehydrogenase/fumarate reductase flavoprotein subunit